jgi:CheY-like chemotaxis protein
VVDDEPGFAEFVGAVAREIGFSVRLATTAAAFRSHYAEQVPDVVVMDVVIPDADGIELTKWLVGNGYTGRLIFASGYNPRYADAARQFGELGGTMDIGVLHKPVTIAELRRTLRLKPGLADSAPLHDMPAKAGPNPNTDKPSADSAR